MSVLVSVFCHDDRHHETIIFIGGEKEAFHFSYHHFAICKIHHCAAMVSFPFYEKNDGGKYERYGEIDDFEIREVPKETIEEVERSWKK